MVTTVPAQTDRVNSTGQEAQRSIKAAQGVLVSLVASNFHSSDLYLQLHDMAAAITAEHVPIFVMVLPAGKTVSIDTPVKFTSGLQVGLSSTLATFTSGGAHGWFLAQKV